MGRPLHVSTCLRPPHRDNSLIWRNLHPLVTKKCDLCGLAASCRTEILAAIATQECEISGLTPDVSHGLRDGLAVDCCAFTL